MWIYLFKCYWIWKKRAIKSWTIIFSAFFKGADIRKDLSRDKNCLPIGTYRNIPSSLTPNSFSRSFPSPLFQENPKKRDEYSGMTVWLLNEGLNRQKSDMTTNHHEDLTKGRFFAFPDRALHSLPYEGQWINAFLTWAPHLLKATPRRQENSSLASCV